MLNRGGKLIGVVLVGLTLLSYLTQTVLANTGTHLGVGDINGQVHIINQVLPANGANDGFPVTLMIDSNTSADDINRLAAAIQAHNYYPIIRINRVCEISPSESVTVVQKVKDAFGQDALVTFGNEINNQARECSNWGQYVTNYNAVNQKFSNISPSALDWYNADYPPDGDFFQTPGMTRIYQNASVRTANAYGCIGDDTQSCQPLNTNTQNTGLQGTTNAQLYLTEFSLSPGGNAPPDANLNKVVQFIENQASGTGAVHITPLVRNVCSNLNQAGEWLIYINGKLFTQFGEEVNPDNCDALSTPLDGSTPTAWRDPSEYYLYPLDLAEPLADAAGQDRVRLLTHNLVVDQGYQAYCPSPALRITKELTSPDALKRFIDLNPQIKEVGTTMGADGQAKGNFMQATIPMFRGQEAEDQTHKTSSFEGYFGAIDPENSSDPVNSGVANSFLTLKQQCIIKVNNLRTAKKMCDMLENPISCALRQPIPNTDYYLYKPTPDVFPPDFERDPEFAAQQSLLKDFEEFKADGVGKSLASDQLACNYLSQPWDSNTITNFDQERFTTLKQGFQNMSLNLDRVYRLAFLVIAPLNDTDDQPITHLACAGKNKADPFWFLFSHTGNPEAGCAAPYINKPKHAPIFIAFKIPDFTTNRAHSLNNYQDTAEIVTDSLRKQEVNNSIAENEAKRRDKLYGRALEAQEMRTRSQDEAVKLELLIDFAGMPQEGAHETGALNQSLVDIINAYKNSCEHSEELPDDMFSLAEKTYFTNPIGSAELAGDIGSPAKVSGDAKHDKSGDLRAGNIDYFSGIVVKDNEPEPSRRSATFGWALKFKDVAEVQKKIQGQDNKQGVQLRTYIVAPIGANLTYIEETLRSFFTTADFEQMKASSVLPDAEGKSGLPKFFPIDQVEFGYSSKAEEHFYDPDRCNNSCQESCHVDRSTGEKTCETICEPVKCRSFAIKLDDHNVGLYIPGAKLGWMIRKLQENLREHGTEAWEYVRSCQRVEDLFLGRCKGNTQQKYGTPDGLPYNGSTNFNQERCAPITDNNNPCSVDNLKPYIQAYWNEKLGEEGQLDESTLTQRATNASIICNAESGGNANSINKGCTDGSSVDYSVGLFQINLLAHSCSEYFNYSWEPPSCEILVDQSQVDKCSNNMANPENNIKEAMRISTGGTNWNPWATAQPAYCDIH
ncbi:MAG: hypothetical protein GF390_02175 [Candidatus Pacebacteria bacterium]|nr:hypothetical protein [Candidatus Paceibacterota bacterium]